MINSNAIVAREVPLRGTSINLCTSPSCEGLRPSCMVLLMNCFFEAFDLFEVVSRSFATANARGRLLELTKFAAFGQRARCPYIDAIFTF